MQNFLLAKQIVKEEATKEEKKTEEEKQMRTRLSVNGVINGTNTDRKRKIR